MIIREIQKEDIDEVVKIAILGFGNSEIAYKEEHYANHINTFPEGQVCVLYDGKIVGSSSSIIINYEEYGDDHTFEDISKDGFINNHNYRGKNLYGLDVVVHPAFRKRHIGKRLYEERRRLCKQFNLQSIIIGGRMPNYHKYATHHSAHEYVEFVQQGKIYDPVLTFQLKNGFNVRSVNANYLEDDTDSLEYAAIMEWINKEYELKEN
ncbi:GNAT family N-acetyltransferase [Pseudogracilibacillus auburnensis]|uniref:Acetyltransferase (GNAT) family protein n=1 Tax=Pseudogracilibacillus auburnensis TaxID=1494959 RepID=A0A2V3W0P4_9BACI|nr:GNAT family N-acetyltransferase [Pseudogracilibacillus auburnensis]PXW87470.1 acetyltransferase (GNAT) family protein [Pseudogracilibacillus auburnensis]